MDKETSASLNRMTQRLYAEHAQSFSQTREMLWNGWQRMLEVAGQELQNNCHQPLRILDLACGNGRFANAAADALEGSNLSITGIDSCINLLNTAEERASSLPNVVYTSLPMDIVEALENSTLAGQLEECPFDFSVCFGFMHHLPTKELRIKCLQALCDTTRTGGLIAVSFWQFMDDEKLSKRAMQATSDFELDLPANDYVMQWRGEPGTYRYCHHFTGEEIADLAASISRNAQVVDMFKLESGNDASNAYVLFRVS